LQASDVKRTTYLVGAFVTDLPAPAHLLSGHLNSAGGTALISDWLIFLALAAIVASRAI
jgi:hypothetical protein